MNEKEQKTIETLLQLVRDLKSENQKFREDVTKQVESVNTKTDKKLFPVTMEQDILRSAQLAIVETITKVMGNYDSPLTKLVKLVVEENSTELRKIISDSFTQVIRTDDFKTSIVSAFSHKVARTIISNNDGLFDKVSNDLKQDQIFKAKMALAVANVVEECLVKK